MGFMISSDWPIVKRGTWLYDGHVSCEVRITRGDVIYGSGDYEDPPEGQADQQVECFYVVYECPTGGPANGGVYMSLGEAVAKVANVVGTTLYWVS